MPAPTRGREPPTSSNARGARLVESVIQRVAGLIMLVFGCLLSAVLALTLWRINLGTPSVGALPITAWLILGALAIFTTIVGVRLVWMKPTAHGSLLSTAGWATLGFVFLGIGASMTITTVRAGRPISVDFILATIAFAALCGLAAWRVHLRSRRVSGDP